MADVKISQLPAAASIASTDVAPVVTGGVTSKVTAQAIVNGGLSGGTANGVLYLDGSKAATSGSALTFNGSTFGISTSKAIASLTSTTGTNGTYTAFGNTGGNFYCGLDSSTGSDFGAAYAGVVWHGAAYPILFGIGNSEQMRLTSTGLGIGTSSPNQKLEVSGSSQSGVKIGRAHV